MILDEKRIIAAFPVPRRRPVILSPSTLTLTARDYPITFGDTNEGSLGVHVFAIDYRLEGKSSTGVVTSSDGTTAKALRRTIC